jgi:hypothetical protein
MSESETITRRAFYKKTAWGLLLVFTVLAILGGGYFAWYHFTDQETKTKFRELQSETRRVERNARVGYHYRSDPEDTSPLGVARFIFPQYDKFNDEDLIEMIRAKFHPNIPKADFSVWMRDPYGQEKIDSYPEHHKEPSE